MGPAWRRVYVVLPYVTNDDGEWPRRSLSTFTVTPLTSLITTSSRTTQAWPRCWDRSAANAASPGQRLASGASRFLEARRVLGVRTNSVRCLPSGRWSEANCCTGTPGPVALKQAADDRSQMRTWSATFLGAGTARNESRTHPATRDGSSRGSRIHPDRVAGRAGFGDTRKRQSFVAIAISARIRSSSSSLKGSNRSVLRSARP